MTIEEILDIDGIVVRKIPKTTASAWVSSEKEHARHKAAGGDTYINSRGREVCIETKTNSLGGLYIVTMDKTQGSLVRFDKTTAGIGKTIPDAYTDMINKR